MEKQEGINIKQKIKDKYVFIYRVLCVLLIILIPIFWIVTVLTSPESKSPPLVREALIVIAALILFGSYKIDWLRKNMQKVMVVLYALVAIWQLMVLDINNFDVNKCLGFLLVSFAISIGFEYRRYYIRFIIFFCIGVVAVLFSNKDAEVNKTVFLVTLFSIQLMSYFLNSSKISTERAIIKTNEKLKIKNKETFDSIVYAKRIQKAILPSLNSLQKFFPDSFILYKPKAIVSGDFYWIQPFDGIKLFAVADCTGHGVPGAMVSVICHNALNRAVREYYKTSPADILNKTRELILDELSDGNEHVADGMDIVLCSIHYDKLEYAGAHNPLWIIRNNELIEIKPDKQPIGYFSHAKPFTNHKFDLQKGDMIYLNTDGFADQFGGKQGKKMKRKYLKNYLLEISNQTLPDQKKSLNKTFEDWKGSFEQIDDVCIMGVKV